MRIKNLLKSLLINLHRHTKHKPDVYIFTLPRAGSTLLSEILNTDPISKTASESFALNEDNLQVLKKYFEDDFLAERYVGISEQNFKQVINYYSDLSKGKNWNSYYWSDFFTSNHKLITKRTIYKTHKFTYYFDDLMEHFKGDYGLYLIRNPVSHSLSRLRKGWDVYIDLYSQAKKIKTILPKTAKSKIDQVNSNGSKLERFIVSWCLENYVFIKKYQENELPTNVFPVFYEDLVLQPEITIKEICSKIKMEYNGKMLSIIDIPSSGIIHSTEETKNQIITGNKSYLVNRWKENLGVNTEEQIKEILTSFNIQIYL